MPTLILIAIVALLLGLLIAFLLMRRKVQAAAAAIESLTKSVTTANAERHDFEVRLAAALPEANRSAQVSIELLRLQEEKGSTDQECSKLNATLIERAERHDRELAESTRTRITLQEEITGLKACATSDAATIVRLEREVSAFAAGTKAREEAFVKERAQIEQLKDQFRDNFAVLSASALKANSEVFLDTAKRVLALQQQEVDADLSKRQTEIKQLVKPLEDGIKAYDAAVQAMERERAQAFGSITEQLTHSVQQSVEVARQAAALRDALRKPNVRGRWGEVQLKNCMDLAGMEEHCDVVYQASSTSVDDELIRPDMIVRMPGGGVVAVDSKTPMEAFLQHIEASTDDERNIALKKHSSAVKARVAELSSSNYMQKLAKSPDFVIMFLPNESFLAMALEREPTLTEEALGKKVLIATPGTLIGLLKVIRYGWNEQRLAENAALIAEEGSKLNTELTRFLLDYARLGRALEAASTAYADSKGRVEKQLSNRSKALTRLGAKNKKALTAAETKLLLEAQIETGEDEEQEEAPLLLAHT